MPTANERPPPLPRPITGVFVRHIQQTACPGYFVMLWLDAEPLQEASATGSFALVNDLPEICSVYGAPDEPPPQEFVDAFERAARATWQELGNDRPVYAVRVVLRDAVWHAVDSTELSFKVAGQLAMREILSCADQNRDPSPVGRSARKDLPVPPMPRASPPPERSPSA